jgi:hypothetical protein
MSAVSRSSGYTLIGAVARWWDGEGALEMAVAGADGERGGRTGTTSGRGRASGEEEAVCR